jgi:uncharacterized protein YbaR (Trm112 family)
MQSHHLSCPVCRIRLRADAPEVHLLEDRCPICRATLVAVSSASEVLGHRCFDLGAFSEQEPDDRFDRPVPPAEISARREAPLSVRDDLDTDRWSDDGGRVARQS